MILKFSAAVAVVTGVILLIVFSLPSAGDEGLLAHFDDIDDTDKTPVSLCYRFRKGQKFDFKCAAESITTLEEYGGRGGGIQRVETEHEFEVVSVDENGVAGMEMLMKRVVLETAGEIGHRKVEMTPEGVRVFEHEEEVEPEEEDIKVREIFPWKYKLEVSPWGKILSGTVSEGQRASIRQLNMFLQSFFPELPGGRVIAGEEYHAKLEQQDEVRIEKRNEKKEFLGYKMYEGRRCAVLKTGFSFQTRPFPNKGTQDTGPWDNRKGQSVTGIFFCPEEGLAPLTFMRVESEWESKSSGMVMRGSSREEAVIKLVSHSISGK